MKIEESERMDQKTFFLCLFLYFICNGHKCPAPQGGTLNSVKSQKWSSTSSRLGGPKLPWQSALSPCLPTCWRLLANMGKTGHAHMSSQGGKTKICASHLPCGRKAVKTKLPLFQPHRTCHLELSHLKAWPHVFGSLLEPLYSVELPFR